LQSETSSACSAIQQGPTGTRARRYKRFTVLYLLSGLAGSVASYVLADLTTAGASGALFGLLGALAAYFARNPRLERAAFQLIYIAAILGVNVVLGLDDGCMADNTGHLAGFATGLWLGWFLAPQWKVRSACLPSWHMCMLLCGAASRQLVCLLPAFALDMGARRSLAPAASSRVAQEEALQPGSAGITPLTPSSAGTTASNNSVVASEHASGPAADQPEPDRPTSAGRPASSTLAALSDLLADTERTSSTSGAAQAQSVAEHEHEATGAGHAGAALPGSEQAALQPVHYVDAGSGPLRAAMVASVVVSLVAFTAAGTLARNAML
jgi:Rhomboid family